MGLTQAFGRINMKGKSNTTVNPLDQNDYLLPDIEMCQIHTPRRSYMGTEKAMELNYFSPLISTISNIEF